MDMFMDKFSQKQTAQEMIQANAAADEKELRRMEEQLLRYQETLEEMRLLSTSASQNLADINSSSLETINRVESSTDSALAKVTATTDAAMEKTAAAVNETVQDAVSKLKESSASSIEKMNDSAREALSKVEQALTEGLEKLSSMEIPTDGVNELVEGALRQIRDSRQEVEETHAVLAEKFKELNDQLTDYVHKENVKVYRNVQAVVVEEIGKQTIQMKDQNENLEGQMKSAKALGRTALIISLLTFIEALGILLLLFGVI